MMLEDIKSVAEQRHMGHDCICSVYSLMTGGLHCSLDLLYNFFGF